MQLKLTFLTGPSRAREILIEADRTLVIGRSSKADVQVPDERASRRHCAVKLESERALIADLGSGNGTFLNGTQIPTGQSRELKEGDKVQVGTTELGITITGAAAATAPTPSAPVAPPPPCSGCGAAMGPEDVALGEKWKGRFFCLRCHPAPEIPGVVLEKRLGEGAMGAVFRGRDTRSNALLAIKVLKLRGAVTQEDRARFVREAATTAALEHANVVRVLGRGETPTGTLFIAMEFIHGRSLKSIIDEKGPLPLQEALSIARQISAALEHAREKHIVHRDVKPENILVQPDGVAKLTDFGLAKSILGAGLSGLTRPGEGMGTLPYMPPEQIENAVDADHRSDIYSLGATIYHMLAGKRPFNAKSNMEFFMKILEQQPPAITDIRKDVPVPVLKIVERAMKKKPDERFQTAGEIARAFEALLGAADQRETADWAEQPPAPPRPEDGRATRSY